MDNTNFDYDVSDWIDLGHDYYISSIGNENGYSINLFFLIFSSCKGNK
jgi:hypothetical protein